MSRTSLLPAACLAGALALVTPGRPASAQPTPSATPAPGRPQPAAAPLRGIVSDSADAPLAGTRVSVVELDRTTVTGPDGRFRLDGLPPGRYALAVQRAGYAPLVRPLALPEDAAAPLRLTLRRAAVALATVQVSASAVATGALTAPQPTAVLDGDALRQAQAPSLGETLEALPGLRSIGMTTGIGKPVIRGLSSNRVVVLDNGQRVESQQWGTDHAPNLETEHSDRVEVIKGPASVLWGSDAIGGVIQVIPRPLPDAIGRRPFTTGRVTTSYNGNLRGPDATLTLEGARGGFGWRGTGTARAMGDMRAPGATLRNTGNTTTNLQGAIGWTGPAGRLALRASNRDERIEIYEDPAEDPAYTGYQDIRTSRIALDGTLPLGAARLEVNVGWERNRRAEFETADARDVTLGLGSTTASGYAHFHHRPLGRVQGLVGVFAWHQRFRKFGAETLIPNTDATDLAAFVFEQAELGRWSLSAGARWDVRTLSTPGDRELALAASDRSWQAFTGNAAAAYRLRDDLALVVNVGRGFRAPSSSDLFANGFHEGTRAFERGDPTVGIETSLNADVGIRVRRPGTTAELHGYSNRIADFIYLRPFGAAGARFDSLAVTQGNAWLRGIEGSLTQQAGRWVALSATADLTLGDNTSTDTPLTYIPPFRALGGIRLADAAGGGRFFSPTLQLTAEHHARQSRLDPMDVATPAYTLLHLVAGITVPTRRAPVTVDLSVRNVGNARYRNFMSRYKEFADGMGRTVVLRVSAALP